MKLYKIFIKVDQILYSWIRYHKGSEATIEVDVLGVLQTFQVMPCIVMWARLFFLAIISEGLCALSSTK